MAIDVLERVDLPFPRSLPEFQRLFPNESACAAYLERARWRDGFVCSRCAVADEPYRFANRPTVLRCRHCQIDSYLTAGTVMERTHTPLSVWFWAAYLVTSQTPGISAIQFQRQLGLSRYETAFQILHKLRVGMVRPDQDQIGGKPGEHVEVDETYVGGRTRGEGRGVHHKTIVAAAVEVRHRKRDSALNDRRNSRYAGRVRLAVVSDRGADALCGFVKSVVAPGARIVTDDWGGYAGLTKYGYHHASVAERGRSARCRRVHADHSSRIFKPQDLVAWYPSWCQPAAPTGVPQRVHVPLQPPLLPFQRIPFFAWYCARCHLPDLCRVLRYKIPTHYI